MLFLVLLLKETFYIMNLAGDHFLLGSTESQKQRKLAMSFLAICKYKVV